VSPGAHALNLANERKGRITLGGSGTRHSWWFNRTVRRLHHCRWSRNDQREAIAHNRCIVKLLACWSE
jgi:hypothetical protein